MTMQPSDPTPEERERELRYKLEVIIADSAPYDPLLHEHEVEALDAYARAVYQRGVRDAMAQMPMRGEKECGCIAVRVTEPVIKYVEVCQDHFLKLDGMRVVGPDSPAVFRALTPPEPTE